MSAVNYARQLRSAQNAYLVSQDFHAYMADCFYIALLMAANELAAGDPRLKYLPTSLTAASYPVKGLVDLVTDRLSCPIEEDMDHEEFLRSWYQHGRRFVDRDTEVVREILSRIGVWRHTS